MDALVFIVIAIAILVIISFWVKRLSTSARLFLRLFSFISLMVLLWIMEPGINVYLKILLTIISGFGVYKSIWLKMKEVDKSETG